MRALFKRWWQIGRQERVLLIEAAFFLFRARLVFAVLPLSFALRFFGSRPGEGVGGNLAEGEAQAIALAIARTARHVPFRARCLEQAFAAFAMLRRRGLMATVHLGVRRRADSTLAAHAWSLSGPIPVTGIDAAAQYVPVAAFTR